MLLSVFFILLSMAFVSVLLTPSPSLLIMWLVILTFYLGLILSKILSSWMMYAVILLFTGGMMVLFMYMLTLVMSMKIVFLGVDLNLSVVSTLTLLLTFFAPIEINSQLNLSGVFSIGGANFILFLAIYLFLVLLVVVKLSSTYKGSLKSMFNHEKD